MCMWLGRTGNTILNITLIDFVSVLTMFSWFIRENIDMEDVNSIENLFFDLSTTYWPENMIMIKRLTNESSKPWSKYWIR